MGYVIAGACLSKLVLAHDCSDTDVETLGEAYVARSEEEIPIGLRWFYCCGLGIALLCMSNSSFFLLLSSPSYTILFCFVKSVTDYAALIAMSHIHKDIEGQRIAKRYRLAVRVAVAVILFCLPLAHKLNSLEIISTTTGLVALILMVDLYGSTAVHDSFFKDKRVCKYSADCHIKKKDVETAIKTGEKISVEELAKGTKGEKCLFE